MTPKADAPQSRSAASENGQNTEQRKQTAVQPLNGKRRPSPPHPVIDCDIHNEVSSIELLMPYLSDHWCDYVRESAFRGPHANDYPGGAPTSARPGSIPPRRGSRFQLQVVREQALAPWNTEIGILNCAYRVQSVNRKIWLRTWLRPPTVGRLTSGWHRNRVCADRWWCLARPPLVRPKRSIASATILNSSRLCFQCAPLSRMATAFMIPSMPLPLNGTW